MSQCIFNSTDLKNITLSLYKWFNHFNSLHFSSLRCDSFHNFRRCYLDQNAETKVYRAVSFFHYIDVIMTTMASQINRLTVVYSTVYSDADQIEHHSSTSLAFVWGIHRDRWIPRTKGQLRGKWFHLITSLCDEGLMAGRGCVEYYYRLELSLGQYHRCNSSFSVSAYWGQDKIAAIFQTTYSIVFSWMKIYEFWLKFQWSFFVWVQ